jgi:predicted transcriptional regulator
MAGRTLTITVDPDWQGALRTAARQAFGAMNYQGETLNFETPGAFFGKLTERRWALLRRLQGAGEMSVRELARHVGRDVRRVDEDIKVLVDVGLVDRTDNGNVYCPFADIHVDMHMCETV